MTTSPEDVKSQFVGDDGWPRSTPVPRSSMLSWMADPSLEVRGVVYHFLCERPELCHIDAPLPDQELYRFVIRYFEDTQRTRPDGLDRVLDASYWRGHQSEAARSELLEWLRSALLRFPHYQELLGTSLEDGFFDPKIRKRVAAWATDPLLARLLPELAYHHATAASRPDSKNAEGSKKRRR